MIRRPVPPEALSALPLRGYAATPSRLLHGRQLGPPDFSRQGRARGWARRRKQGPAFQHRLARCGHFCPSPWSGGVENRAARAFLSSSLEALHRSLLILLLCILLALFLELRRRLRSSSHLAVGRTAPDSQIQRVHKTTDSKASHALSCPGPKPGDDSPSQQRYRHQDIRWQRYLLYWAIVVVQLQSAGAVGESRVEAFTSGVSGAGISPPLPRIPTREGAGAATSTIARPSIALAYPWSAKRAYRRARARAAHGPTMYRGSLCSASELQAQYGQPLPPRDNRKALSSRVRPHTRASHPARRVRVLTFNVFQDCPVLCGKKCKPGYAPLRLTAMTSFSYRRRVGLACQTSHPDSGGCVGTPIADNTRGWPCRSHMFNATPTSKAEYISRGH